MHNAPVNVVLQEPTKKVSDWDKQKTAWTNWNNSIGGNCHFYPLTIKAAYVIGIIYDFSKSIDVLLHSPKVSWQTTYFPAYSLFAASVELLGRCIRGNETHGEAVKNSRAGFNFLVFNEYDCQDTKDGARTAFETDKKKDGYTIDQLITLRHFVAHGQATVNQNQLATIFLDTEILAKMQPYLAAGLNRYWHHLQGISCTEDQAKILCNHLALSNVLAIRGWPVYNMWSRFGPRDGKHDSVEKIFNEDFNWTVD